MAKGTPDWTAEVKPHLGKTYRANLFRNHPGNELYVMANVLGKGIIVGGYLIHLGNTLHHVNCQLAVEIDGQLASPPSMADMEDINLSKPFTVPLYLLKYNPIAFEYSFAFSHGWTFDYSFMVSIDEQHGEGSTLINLYYSMLV